MLVMAVMITAVAVMIVTVVMPAVPALVGMTMVMFMAVVSFVLVMMTHAACSSSVSCFAPRRGPVHPISPAPGAVDLRHRLSPFACPPGPAPRVLRALMSVTPKHIILPPSRISESASENGSFHRGVDMTLSKSIVGLLTISAVALCPGAASAWDTRWQFTQEATSNHTETGTRDIEMQKKSDLDSMNRFKGTTDGSSGYTVMRNLNGDTMRGYIQKDGSGLLRDQNGNFYNVHTRW